MIANDLMHRLHGTDVYAGFIPAFSEDLQGWNSYAPIFRDIVHRERPSVVVDVGVWKGASSIFIAELLRDAGIDGVVISVDTFLGSAEHWNRDSPDFSLIPRRHGLPALYGQFLSNIVRRGLQNYIVPLPLTSDAAVSVLLDAGIVPQLVHIDAAHDFDSVLRDARGYWSLLRQGGYLMGDDYHETWPGVVRAANQFAQEVGVGLEVSVPKWIVRKG